VLSGRFLPGQEFPPQDQRARWPRQQMDAWIRGAERFRFLERPGRSMGQAALAFCLAGPGSVFAIPGMKSVPQVRENVMAATSPDMALSPKELTAVRVLWKELHDLPPR